MKSLWKAGLIGGVVLAWLAEPNTAHARRNGPPAGVTGSPASSGFSCAACHTGSLGFGGSVQILGAPAYYQLNAVYDLTVRIADPTLVGAGFQLSAETSAGVHAGTLIAIDAVNTRINTNDSGFIEHKSTGVDNSVANWASVGNAAEYAVRWQAPATSVGPVTFWASGNAINNNFSPSGDHVYVTSETAGIPIPAVSEWGLLVLGLLLATAATLLAARRMIPSQP